MVPGNVQFAMQAAVGSVPVVSLPFPHSRAFSLSRVRNKAAYFMGICRKYQNM